MKQLEEFVNEKLKISIKKKQLPKPEEFINALDVFLSDKESEMVGFSKLYSIGRIDSQSATDIQKLPAYKFTGDEPFLKLKSNSLFKVPEDTVYISIISITSVESNPLIEVRYLPKEGLNSVNFKTRRWFNVEPKDLLNIIGEDLYLEMYEYLTR